MVLGKLSLEAELFGQLVAVALEIGLDLFQPIETGSIGDEAGGIEAGSRIVFAEVQ